jgi:outer membrane protein W
MPFGFGIKGGFLNSNVTGLDKAKGTWADASESPLFNPSYQAGLFGEFAFHDYVGAGLDLMYERMHDSINKKGDDKKTVSFNIQQMSIIPLVKFYPMGRDIDSGILNVHVGPEFILPLMTDASIDDKEAKDLIKKDDLNSYNIAAFGGVGYEFPVGLLLEARGSYGFMDVFTKTSPFKTEAKKALGLAENDSVNPWYVNLSLGYNFARLLEE